MFDESHVKLEIEETAAIVDTINKQIDGSIFDALETVILSIEFSFYPTFRFLSITDYAITPSIQRFAFQKKGTMDFTIIDWNFKTIQKINKESPISLDQDNVIEYVRFYFEYVKGRHGRFIICETADHIRWKEEPSDSIKQSLNKALSPLEIHKKNSDGSYVINAFMMLKSTLFGVQIFVRPNGNISMSDHQIVMEDIPVLDHILVQ